MYSNECRLLTNGYNTSYFAAQDPAKILGFQKWFCAETTPSITPSAAPSPEFVLRSIQRLQPMEYGVFFFLYSQSGVTPCVSDYPENYTPNAGHTTTQRRRKNESHGLRATPKYEPH